MAKMLEDALRALGILQDDDPKHVARSIIEVTSIARQRHGKGNAQGSRPHVKDEDYLIVTIKPYEQTNS